MSALARVVNLGCKVNRVESDSFERQLNALGFTLTEDAGADVVVLNTCTVTAVAEKKTRKAVRRALSENPRAKVIVTGCAALQKPDVYLEMSDRVDVVPKWEMSDHLRTLGSPAECPQGDLLACEAEQRTQHKSRMGIKVQDGCANACSYCIVHSVRGPETSQDPQVVLADARRLAKCGVKEIMLTGINLGRYNHDGKDLAWLLHQLLELGLDARYRISSIEPDNLSTAMIEAAAASNGRICRHFHLPLQSGSDAVLSDMCRKYTRRDFLETVEEIRLAIPEASISTDVICGFPGETDDDFMQTCELCETVGFSKIHVFPYSEREGTPAAARSDQVPHDVRLSRAAKLRSLTARLRAEDLASRKGSCELAVVEDGGVCLTESYHWVAAPAGSREGDLCEVRL